MPSSVAFLLTLTVILVCVNGAYAFGAGNDIPAFSYVSGKAFRHGDIESILENLSKSAGGAAGAGGILGFAKHVLRGGRGPKFSKADVKRVYFGNWLRDYSQAMDIAGLSKLSPDTLVLIIAVLGFMTFGYTTREFELTADRLGVYLPVEHIDNPKGYAEKEGDARQFHPKLRPPVEPRELEIDESNGMKKYIATDNEGFDTSAAHVRRIFKECIEKGRQAGGQDNEDLWEAFRLLGTGLHTLEDFPAHSNFTELVLCKMGHDVFCHVGDDVRIDTPNGRAAPVVTGTFGGADFLHSLLGEATDKISQSSVTDLASEVNKASEDGDNKIGSLVSVLKQIPSGGGDEKSEQAEEIKNKSKAYNFDPDNILPPEAQTAIRDILKWHDDVMRDVEAALSRIPGLQDLLENLTNALNAYIYTVIAPYIAPALTEVTGVLGEGSKAVIDSDDQFAVFNNPDASDPSHSMLSKDHFNLILNEPCGLVAQTIVEHSVNLIVQAWSDDSDPDEVISQILKTLHHPYFADGSSEIQNAMRETVERWFEGLGSEGQEVIEKLSKDGVREHRNVRSGSQESEQSGGGYGGSAAYGSGHHHGGGEGNTYSSGYGSTYNAEGNNEYGSGHGTYGQSGAYGGGGYGGGQTEYNSYGGHEENSYGQSQSYGSRHHEGYGREGESYEQSESYEGRQYGSNYNREEGSYGESESYGNRHHESNYGQSDSYDRYGSNYESGGYERRETEQPSYYGRQEYNSGDGGEHQHRRHHEYGEGESGYGGSYSSRNEYSGDGYQPSYERRDDDDTFGAERLNINEDGYNY